MIASWWERFPGRLEMELAALDAAGIRYVLDEDARRDGVIQLRIDLEVGGQRHALLAVYPDCYPYTRVEVRAEDLTLNHHQHPFAKNICLIGRATANWLPRETLAHHLMTRFPIAIATGNSDDRAMALGREEEQAEPFSDYYTYESGSIVLIDGSWEIDPAVTSGKLRIGVERLDPLLRGVVLEVRDDAGNRLAGIDETLAKRYSQVLLGSWVRCPHPVNEGDPNQFRTALKSMCAQFVAPRPHGDGSHRLSIVGVLFPEETGWREVGDGWVFHVHAKSPKIPNPRREAQYFARPGRAGQQDLQQRVPELACLAQCKIAVIGLGGIGAPSALEFARAGVGELHLLDHDDVDPGTAVRWPRGFQAAGLLKTVALEQVVSADYPYTRVVTYPRRLGGAVF